MLVPLTAECQMYEEWKSLMPYVYTLFHKTGQLESASSNQRTQNITTHLPSLASRVSGQCLAHVVACVGNTLQLPFANVLIPVHITFQHLLQTHSCTCPQQYCLNTHIANSYVTDSSSGINYLRKQLTTGVLISP